VGIEESISQEVDGYRFEVCYLTQYSDTSGSNFVAIKFTPLRNVGAMISNKGAELIN
jgi:hypothetical protein